MNNFDISEPVVLSPTGRKKRRCPDESERSVSKKGRHSALGKVPLLLVYIMYRIHVWPLLSRKTN